MLGEPGRVRTDYIARMSSEGPQAGARFFHALASDLEARFAQGVHADWVPGDFEAAALEVFRYQYEHNETYRGFCDGRGLTSETVGHWTDVPAVPTRAFRHLDLASVPGEPEALFLTSGTTSDAGPRGRHLVPRLSLYRASLLPNFKVHVMPDLDSARVVSLVPSPSALPESSLSHMVGVTAAELGTEVTWAVDAAGEFDEVALRAAWHEGAGSAEPVVLIGTAFALLHALDRGVTLGPLPEGSRIMETGGYKGRARELPREELYSALGEATGVPVSSVVNEYGMTELLSQLYEPVLAGEEPGSGHAAPPWVQVRALDPTTLEPCEAGELGILAFYDLANAGSVAHVLTEDTGRVHGGRVFLEGRVQGAEPRGCSRAMDEIMSLSRSR